MTNLAAQGAQVDGSVAANHRIANNLAMIAALIRQEGSSISAAQASMTGDEVRAVLDTVSGRLDTVAKLHRQLTQGRTGKPLDLNDYLFEVAEGIVAALAAPGAVELEFAAGPACPVAPELALWLGLIVSEWVTNSIKYAHPSGVPGQLRVACHLQPDGGVELEVADDGVGLPDEVGAQGGGSVGFRMVRSLVEQLDAKLECNNSPLGVSWTLRVPPLD
jgi:two-component sensor histidine kinase